MFEGKNNIDQMTRFTRQSWSLAGFGNNIGLSLQRYRIIQSYSWFTSCSGPAYTKPIVHLQNVAATYESSASLIAN